MLITLLKGTSTAYLQPAASDPTFTRLVYYPLNKREPEWGVALCNESFSRVMKLVWNKESGSNIKLCPITIITDLSMGWEQGRSFGSGPIQTYRLDNNMELMPGIMEFRQRRIREGGRGGGASGRHVFTRKNTHNKGRRGDREGRQAGFWGGKPSGYKERGGEGRGRSERGDGSTKGLMLRNTRSPSLSPSPTHYPCTGQRTGGGEVGSEGGEMTFSFVLLRAPYYHLSRETLSLHLSLFVSFLFSLSLTNNRFE